MKKFVMFIVLITMFTSTGVKAAEVPRESAPCNATNEAITVRMILKPSAKNKLQMAIFLVI